MIYWGRLLAGSKFNAQCMALARDSGAIIPRLMIALSPRG
jgi:hypothetical protein